jgi:hypothetical protein
MRLLRRRRVVRRYQSKERLTQSGERMAKTMTRGEVRIDAGSLAAERLACEAQELAAKRIDPTSPYFRGGAAAVRPDRRRFVLRSMAAIGAGGGWLADALAEVQSGSAVHEVAADASKVPGYPLAAESYGTRSQFETSSIR